MCVADFLNERFETPLLVEGARRAGGRRHLGRPLVGGHDHQPAARARPRRAARSAGGPPALVAALERAARAAGAEIRTGAEVARHPPRRGGAVAGRHARVGRDDRRAAGRSPPAIRSARCSRSCAPGTLPLRIEERVPPHPHAAAPRPRSTSRSPGRSSSPPGRASGSRGDPHRRRARRRPRARLRRHEVPRASPSARTSRSACRPSPTRASRPPATTWSRSSRASRPTTLDGGWTDAAPRGASATPCSRRSSATPRTCAQRIVARELLTPADLESALRPHRRPAPPRRAGARPAAGHAPDAVGAARYAHRRPRPLPRRQRQPPRRRRDLHRRRRSRPRRRCRRQATSRK